MWILLIAVSFIAALILILAFFGFSQPRIAKLERSILIDADPNTVFPAVSNLRTFVTWSPWSAKDPDMQQTFTGMDGTVGSAYSWKGNNKVGEGKMEITGLQPGKQTDLAIDFGHRGRALSAWVVENAGNQTQVTWKFESDMGSNVLMRCFQPMMKKFIGNDYAMGLNNLKRQIEAGKTATPSTTANEDPVTPEQPTGAVTETPPTDPHDTLTQPGKGLPDNGNKNMSHINHP